jgi:catechol 2,3-dioxygenase-like lactoylglutathione lyase family enzyme
MSTTAVRTHAATRDASVGRVDMKLEAIVIPVSDADRAKQFYRRLGWRLDADFAFDNGFRVVQFTPPGSGCSIQFGTNITPAAAGSVRGLYLIVSDVEAARPHGVAGVRTAGPVAAAPPERAPVASRVQRHGRSLSRASHCSGASLPASAGVHGPGCDQGADA